MQNYIEHADTGPADINERFAQILAELDWLSSQSAHLASIGLRELRRTIRTYTVEGDDFTVDVSATASAGGVTVVLEDSGPAFHSIVRRITPAPAGIDDHRLRIIDQDFDEISYSRALGRSRWVLRRFAEPTASSVRHPDAA